MSRKAVLVTLSLDVRDTLVGWARSNVIEHRLAVRAQIILAAAEGEENNSIARRLSISALTVHRWRKRFVAEGLAGLEDGARPGPAPIYDDTTVQRILAKIDEAPPQGHATWTGGLVARSLGDVSADYVWRVLRQHGIALQRRRSWCVSTDPEFAAKAADVVALYLDPPRNAVVLCVDEKPHIQALERAQGYLKLPNGRAVTGFSHEYKRHGTTTLFSALNVLTGQVKAGHYARRRRVEFLDFMNRVVAEYPAKEIHVILDNLSTHKPKDDTWLARRPNVHFHFTPTHSSWLNQIECWFSILSRRALTAASFTSPRQLRDAIDAFVQAYNETAMPFQWTKRTVHQATPKLTYQELRK